MAAFVPDWVSEAIFYQIFPDRYARGSRSPLAPGARFKNWGSPPEAQGFQGGDLYGIAEKLDYLERLGVNALYLNPVFASACNHRYHTYDYYRVDPLLGGDAALRELLDRCHERGMRVVLDGVFNHTGRGFWAFHHLLENGPDSPYLDWFTVRGWPLNAYSSGPGHPPNYDCWAGLPALPRLNTANPEVREYLLGVARHWIEFGIDGWRLDVPEEITSSGFWQEFRRVVKEANPEAYLCGEIWHPAPDWLKGDRFDGVMNYPFSLAALGFFGERTLRKDVRKIDYVLLPLETGAFSGRIERLYSGYRMESHAGLLNLLDSHDTPRALWMLGGDKSALRLAVLFQMTMPGAPCIYYGDEIGLSGGGDPLCRAAFPWQAENTWDTELFEFYRKATALRRKYACLRRGEFYRLHANDGVYVFGRSLGEERVVVVLNTNENQSKMTLDLKGFALEGTSFRSEWGKESYVAQNSRLEGLSLPPREGLVLAGEL